MSYFNTVKPNQSKPQVVNHAQGKSFALTPKLEVATLLTTSLNIKSNYYEKGDERVDRLKKLISDNSGDQDFIEFVAKATVYTRKVVGLKTISHIATALLTKYTGGKKWAKPFYSQVVNYIPDISETIGAYKQLFKGDKKIGTLPKAMQVSFKNYLSKANYHLASKWQMSNKSISLIDLVNLLHCKNDTWINELMTTGTLKPAETKEVLLSKEVAKAKSEGKSDKEINEVKNKVYADLNSENKMGYYAMITGLVQVSSGTDEQIDIICKNIENREAIKKSLIHPLQLVLAYSQILTNGHRNGSMKIMTALSNAIELCYNIPEVFANTTKDLGKTCIFLDISGSMSGNNEKVASIISAVLLKFGNTQLVRYSTWVDAPKVNLTDSVFTIAKQIQYASGGTEIELAFKAINHLSYDKIVVITDMQDFGTDRTQGNTLFNQWKKNNNPSASLYSIDIAGYGNSIFNNNSDSIFTFSGFDKMSVDYIINSKQVDLVAVIEETVSFS